MVKRQIWVQVDEEGTFGDLYDNPKKLAEVKKRWYKTFGRKTAMEILDSAQEKRVKS